MYTVSKPKENVLVIEDGDRKVSLNHFTPLVGGPVVIFDEKKNRILGVAHSQGEAERIILEHFGEA